MQADRKRGSYGKISRRYDRSFMNAIEERLAEGQKNKIPFSRFLEEKMDAFDYSNTSLAKKVFHRVEKKKEGTVSYVL